MTEIKRDGFLSEPTQSEERIATDQRDAIAETVGAINQLSGRLGFTLNMAAEESGDDQEGQKRYNVILTPSQPVHQDFFAGKGIFWQLDGSGILGKSANMRILLIE